MTKRRIDRPIEGYPVEEPFKHLAEMRSYFARDYETITCLRCGRKLKELAYHVWKMHNMSVDEYRDLYGIPTCYGLVSPELHDRLSEHSQRLVADGKVKGREDMDVVRNGKVNERKRPPVRAEICAENLSEVNKDCTGEYSRKRAAAPKRGSKEHSDACRERVTEKAIATLKTFWKGKKRNGVRGKMSRD